MIFFMFFLYDKCRCAVLVNFEIIFWKILVQLEFKIVIFSKLTCSVSCLKCKKEMTEHS